MKQKLFKNYNINSAIMFYPFGCLIILYFDIETNIKNLFALLCFTILYWVANSLQVINNSDKDK